MAWIVPIPPTPPRYSKERWQVRYLEQGRERSGGTYTTLSKANAWKRRIERGERPPDVRTRRPRNTSAGAGDGVPVPVETLTPLETFGDFVERWWPTWSTLHPMSADSASYIVNSRILPVFGTRLLPRVDAVALAAWSDALGAWKASLVAEKLRPHTVNDYLGILSKIINAAVDAELFDRSPMRRRSGSGRVPLLRNLETEKVDVWLTIPQLGRLADAIHPRYRALIILAGRAGLRFGECAGLLWIDLALETAHDDGAVSASAG